MRLILATQSEFRINIYKKLGFDVDAIPSLEEEIYSDKSNPIRYVEELSKIKAYSVAKKVSSGIVIGTDTIAVVDNIIFEKPKNLDEVRSNMRLLQGRENLAISGITIIDIENNVTKTIHEITRVTFAKMDDEEIEWYINNVSNALQCAGYSVSKEGGRFVTKIEGDYNNIFGAPVARVYQEIRNLNLAETNIKSYRNKSR